MSNAFEGKRDTPLLGMERFVSPSGGDASLVDADVAALFQRPVDGRPSLIVAGRTNSVHSRSQSESHGGFDNDPATMNTALWRILNAKPRRPFELRDLQF